MEFPPKQLKDLYQVIIKEALTNAFFKSLAYGILFSLLMTVMIGFFADVLDFDTSKFPYIHRNETETARWLSLIFVSFSFLLAILGLISDIHSREDILTPLRKKLVGNWEVRAQTWAIEGDTIALRSTTSTCTITIEDIGRKLIMHFEIRESDIFADQDINITHITLSYSGEPRQLIYFHEFDLLLNDPIGEGSAKITKYTFPFLGILNISSKADEIKEMHGRWYDINNTVFDLARHKPNLKGFKELSEAVEGGRLTFKGDLRFKKLPKV